MEDDELNLDLDQNRALAHHMHELYGSTLRLVMEEGIHLSRWVLTSLLAINGGAAIATWGITMDPHLKVSACVLFILGIVLSLLSAHITVLTLPKRIAPLGELIGYWISVRVDGIRAVDLESQEKAEAANKRATRAPMVVGWASMVAFLLGVSIAGFGGINEEKQLASTTSTKTQ